MQHLSSVVAARVWRSALRSAACALLLVAGACSEQIITPAAQPPAPQDPLAAMELRCTASVRAATVTCQAPAPTAGGASGVIYGGQNSYVRMISSGSAYDSERRVFSASVSVQNLLPQTIGSTDGVTGDAKGIQVFYATEPGVTAGSGAVSAGNADGTAVFLGTDVPYYQYSQLLASGATSAPRVWEWNVTPGVDAFTFSVYVSTVVTPVLLITEVMANPSAVDDSVGEYIELYNPGLAPVDLSGYRLTSRSGSSTESVALPSGATLPSRQYGVIAARANPARNGGVTAIAEWGGTAIQLSNSTSASAPDYIKVSRPGATAGTFVALDSVAWAPVGTTTAPPTGRTRELLDLKADNSNLNSAVWNTGYRKYGIGDGTGEYDRGTPGAVNGAQVPVGPVATVRISPGFAVVDTLRQFRRFSAFAEDTLGQASSTTITWTSTNPAVVTIDGTGLVTQVDTGRTLIIATTTSGRADSAVYGVFAYSPASIYRGHVEFGVPVTGLANDNNNIVILSDRRTQYNLSYNASRGGPNWVSWNLNRTQFGRVSRAPTFYTDPLLAQSGAYQVTTCDYTGSGYTRGHMTQSEQRTQTRAENDTTFLMSNILPQTNELNTGPWGDLEEYGNELARFQQKEIYNVAGGVWPSTPRYLVPSSSCGPQQNRVQIPESTWKVMVVLPYGKGLADVHSASDIRVIAVNMPNTTTVNAQPWTAYKVSVDQIEALTGYDLLAALPDAIENAVEAGVDP